MGLAHFISIRYIEEEIYKGPEFVVLDDFVKLEKHGAYTFIAQVCVLLKQITRFASDDD
jgi:hypothetical protein